MRNRFDTSPRLLLDGTPEPFEHADTDLDIYELLAYLAPARRPWSYPVLPTSYIAALLKRDLRGINTRLSKLRASPVNTIYLPSQPVNFYRELVHALDRNGADKLREQGICLPKYDHGPLAHELGMSIWAASFEHSGLPITPAQYKTKARPDWVSFIADDYLVFCEFHMGSQSSVVIEKKVDDYLTDIIQQRLDNALVLFMTTSVLHRDRVLTGIRNAIDTRGLDHSYGRHFAVGMLPEMRNSKGRIIVYTKDLTKLPPLGTWALGPYVFPSTSAKPLYLGGEHARPEARQGEIAHGEAR